MNVKKSLVSMVYLVALLLLSACSMFASHYEARRHENFTKLKAIHIKLLEDWSKGSYRDWDRARVSGYCDRGDLSYRQAYEYLKAGRTADKEGMRTVKILWEEFMSNCALVLKQDKPFSKEFRNNLLPAVIRNYDYAIKGEYARVQVLK